MSVLYEPDLAFVHLSDVHFRCDAGGIADLNSDLRKQIECDLRRLRSQVPHYDAVLLTGDLAWSGQEQEYSVATEWIESLCEEIACPLALMTPGNHDVDRAVIEKDKDIRELHTELRSCDRDEIQNRLQQIIQSGKVEQLLLPMKAYISFASHFSCGISPDQLHWEHTFPVSKLSLRVRGMTSTLVSDANDNEDENRLVLGCCQTTLDTLPGVEYATLAHHPPSWLRDEDESTRYLDSRSRLQLYGHRHSQRISRIDDCVRIVAGAAQPSRSEPGWDPRYYVICLRFVENDGSPSLETTIFPRRWSQEHLTFVADMAPGDRSTVRHALPLGSGPMPAAADRALQPTAVMADNARPRSILSESREELSPIIRVQYRLQRLAPERQYSIAQRLKLGMDDMSIETPHFAQEVVARATKSKKLLELYELVEQAHGDGRSTINPFNRGTRRS